MTSISSSNETGSRSPKGGPKSPNTSFTQKKGMGKVAKEKKIAEDEFMASAIGDVEWLRQSLRGNRGVINFDKNGLAPIHLAAIHGRLDCLKLMVEKFKIDVNEASSTGWRPIHLVISNQTGKRAFGCLLYLLEHGADPSVCNDDGITPMHQAASEGHGQCLKALIEVGAMVDGKDHRGHRPIDLAKLWGYRKCARILAAEMWHQDKDNVATEMKQLNKVKMQQVLQEIEDDEHNKADQQFYGEMAFNQWLSSRGLDKKSTEKTSKLLDSSSTKRKKNMGQGSDTQADGPKSQSLYRANSAHPPSDGNLGKRPSPIQEEGGQGRRPLVSQGVEGYALYSRGSLFGDLGDRQDTSKQVQEQSLSKLKWEPTFTNPEDWNFSTKLPKKEYVTILEDHFPRDEYTMMPHNPPQRMSRSPTMIHVDTMPGLRDTSRRSPTRPENSFVVKQSLSADMSQRERNVVYKCKTILDVEQKKHWDVEVLYKPEAGLHLTNDPESTMFKMGLMKNIGPATPSNVIPSISRWSAHPRMTGMHKKGNTNTQAKILM